MRDNVYNNPYGFDIPATDIPSKEMMGRYQAGDSSVIEPIVTGLIGYAIDQVDWFIRMNPMVAHYKEDLCSESMLALHEAVLSHLGKSVGDSIVLMVLVKRRIFGALRNWITAMGQVITLPHSDAGRIEHQRICQEEIQEHHAQVAEADIFSEIWFEDAMTSMPDDVETVVREKIGGMSDREISRMLGVSRRAVASMLDAAAVILER